jgi:hypothetical protein
MNTKQLFVRLALIGVSLVGTAPASAAAISFSEDPSGTAAIAVATDIAGATTAAGVEFASLSLGNVTGPSTLLFRRQMTIMGTMTGEGGGNGVSDILELDSFLSDGATVGFLATFRSDPDTVPEMGLPPLGNFPTAVTNLLENGNLQLLTPDGFLATLPGLGLVSLAVSARSDADEGPVGVPEPSTLALLSAGLLGFGMIRRRRTAA